MAFYIKPPLGYVQLSTVERITWQRLRFLEDVSKHAHSVLAMTDLVQELDTVAHSDCLIEGSSKDITSHFLLRLACAQDKEMERFFVHSETELFRYRFSCLTYKELMMALKPLRRLQHQIKDQDQLSKEYKDVAEILYCLTNAFSWKTIINSFVNSENNKFVKLPFVHILDLVWRRAVLMDHGDALVPCSKLGDVLTNVFRLLLERGLILARKALPNVMNNDARIAQLFNAIKVYFHKQHEEFADLYNRDNHRIISDDIDSLQDYFPPCMSHLHQQLRLKHRLDHSARIQYTLFLKELGLPMMEALQFWREEYSQLPSNSAASHHSCVHSWNKDRKRYIYSIRHLYGLEGARINYRGHCCHTIQNQLISGSGQGGCPFRHFDRQHLIRRLSLDSLPLDAVREVMKLSTEEGHYSAACHVYLRAKLWKNLKSRKLVNSNHVRHLSLSSDNSRYKKAGVKTHTQITKPPTTDSEDTMTCFPSSSFPNNHHNSAHHNMLGMECTSDELHFLMCNNVNRPSSHGRINCCDSKCIQAENVHEMDALNLTQPKFDVTQIDRCFPSQQIVLGESKKINVFSSEADSLAINKPVDFYNTYKTLVESMKNMYE